jgi:glycosyltransferase involved in cell wall biosynthesis
MAEQVECLSLDFSGTLAMPPILTFAITVPALKGSGELRFRCDMLAATLRSLMAQTEANFHVMVATDREPPLAMFTDPRIEFVPFDAPLATNLKDISNDKVSKLRAMAELHAQRGGGCFMSLDMDDFVSRDLVAFVRDNPDPNGYVIDSGYLLDATTMKVAPLYGPTARYGRLNKSCGSSSIIKLQPQDLQSTDGPSRYARLRAEGHFMVEEAAMSEGRPLMRVPFRAVVYTKYHGANWSRLSGKSMAAADPAVFEKEGADSSTIATEFTLPTRYPLQADYMADGTPATPPARDASETGLLDRRSGPSLSVAISTYKRPDGLRRLLAALRPQVAGLAGREIVVVNDGSHDDAYDAVRADFADVIKYRALPANGGIAEARNAAAELAGSDYLVFIDDDCVPPVWWLDWLASRLLQAPELDVVAGVTRALTSERMRFFSRVQAGHRLLPAPSRSPSGMLFVTANVAIRRSLFSALGGFGFPGFYRAGEDTELANRLLLAGAAMAIDTAWMVAHEVESTFPAVCRRYWRYGYANVSLMPLTTSPPVHDSLGWYRRRRHLRNWLTEYREQRKLASGVSDNRMVQALSTFAASLVRMSYYDGCAAALRDRDRRRERDIGGVSRTDDGGLQPEAPPRRSAAGALR